MVWACYEEECECTSEKVREVIDLAQCKRGRGRPKMSWNAVIRSDMKYLGLTEDMTQDRNVWRSRIKIVDHR